MKNGLRISWEQKSSVSINAEKTNNIDLPDYVERFKNSYGIDGHV